MAKKCPEGQYLDHLVRSCMNCNSVCQRLPVIDKCTNYCASAQCKALPGHQYDRLLKKCMNCTEICGRHLAECSEHCPAASPPMTTRNLIEVSTLVQTSMLAPSKAPEAFTLLLYSLLAVCIVLLFSNLLIALVVFLRGRRSKTSNPDPAVGENKKQKDKVRTEQEVCRPGRKLSSKGFPFCPNTDPADDSSPTETCVCVHCFPDLKALSQSNNRPQRTPFSTYQHTVLHKAQIQNGGPSHQTEENFQNFRPMAQEGAEVG